LKKLCYKKTDIFFEMQSFVKIKLVLLGDTEVGKSSTVVRFVKNKFSHQCATIGATFLNQKVKMEDFTVSFQIWDTAGQEKFKSLVPMYYKGAHAALVVYDITDRESFENSKGWVNELQKSEGVDIVIALAGNKVDLEERRKVQRLEAKTFAEQQGFIFRETSAKTGENVRDIFRLIAEKIQRVQEADKELLDINSLEEKTTTSWC